MLHKISRTYEKGKIYNPSTPDHLQLHGIPTRTMEGDDQLPWLIPLMSGFPPMVSHFLRCPPVLSPFMPHRPLGQPIFAFCRPFLNSPGPLLNFPCQFLFAMRVGSPRPSTSRWTTTRTVDWMNRHTWTRGAPPAAAAAVKTRLRWTSESPASPPQTSVRPRNRTSETFLGAIVGPRVGDGHFVGLRSG